MTYAHARAMIKAIHQQTLLGRAVLIAVLAVACITSCRRAPDETEHFTHAALLLQQYLTTNALGAEAAMLELEKYTRECEKAGSREIKFNQHYAAIYSRLYLVDKALGKQPSADRYYQLAADYWLKEFSKRDLPQPTPQQIREQIEKVDRHFEEPQWKGQK